MSCKKDSKTSAFFRYCTASFEKNPGLYLVSFFFIFAVLWAFQCIIFKNVLQADGVESVSWGSKLQPGYYKHPPLSAWIAYFTAVITGYSSFFQVLLDTVCTALGAWFIYLFARIFFERTRAALSVLLLLFIHYYAMPSLVFDPNSIMTALLPCMAWLFCRAVKGNMPQIWLVFGLVSGIAFLGKYTASLILLSMLAGMIFHKEARKCFLSPWPWLSGIVFLLICAPHLYWLVQNDFPCFRYARMMSEHHGNEYSAPMFALYILLLVSYPLLVQLAVLLLTYPPRLFKRAWHGKRLPVSREAFYWSGILTFPTCVLYVLVAACGGHIETPWLSTISALTGVFAISVFPFFISRRQLCRVFLPAVILITGVFIISSIDLAVNTRSQIHMDPQKLIGQLETYMEEEGYGRTVPCLVGTRELVNIIEFYHPDHPLSVDMQDFLSMKKYAPVFEEKGVIVLTDYEEPLWQTVRKLNQGCASEKLIKYSSKALSGKEKIKSFWTVFVPPKKAKK